LSDNILKNAQNPFQAFPERIIAGWRRKEGYKLQVEDLAEILNYEPKPEVLVIGTGYYGIVKISSEVKNTLKSQGITFVAQSTRDTWQTFNILLNSNRQVADAFHFTC
jgi:hypothetical protein